MGKLPTEDLKNLLNCIKQDSRVVVSPRLGFDAGVHLMEDGKYLVEGLKFSMPGWWVVTFYIQAGDMTDHVSFNLLLR